MKLDNEEIVSNPTQVLKEIEDFYRIMYTSKISSDNDIQNSQYERRFQDFF